LYFENFVIIGVAQAMLTTGCQKIWLYSISYQNNIYSIGPL